MTGEDGTRIEDLVVECLDRIEDEGPEAEEAVCAAHPELAGELRRRLEALRRAGLMGVTPSPEVPDRVGEFRLLRRLGGGGMGVVYLAYQESLGRQVAIKVIRPDQLYFEGARERFRREVDLISSFSHPGIVPVHAFGEEGGLPYFAMELVQGCTLAEVLRRVAERGDGERTASDLGRAVRAAVEGSRAPDESDSASAAFQGSWTECAVRLVLQVARALQHAHERGVLHRDVKPSNLMATPDGRVLLFDFGLASSAGSSRITRTGAMVGSLPYVSPEQLSGEPADERSDVYSLGVTLYELLALAPPFEAENVEGTCARILDGRPTPLRALCPGLPWDVETVCLTAMEREPGRRYASAAAFARDLENLLALRPIRARRPSTALRARRWVQRHPALTVGLVLGLLILLGGPTAYAVVTERANQRVEAKNEEIEAKNEELVRALSDVESSLDTTLETIRFALANVTDDELREVPGVARVRERLATRALETFEEVAALRPDDPELGPLRARLHGSRATVLQALGRADEADAEFASALDGLRDWVARTPRDESALHRLAELLEECAILRASRGDFGAALLLFEEQLDVYARLGESGADVRFEQLTASVNVAWQAFQVGERERALSTYAGAIEEARALVAASASSRESRGMLAHALTMSATVHNIVGERVPALALFDEAFEIWSVMAADEDATRADRQRLVELSVNYASLLSVVGRLDRAEEVVGLSLPIAREIVRQNPFAVDPKRRLAQLYGVEGLMLSHRGMTDRVLASQAAAIEILEEAYALDPDEFQVCMALGTSLLNRASECVAAGRVDEALGDLERSELVLDAALALSPANPTAIHNRLGARWIRASIAIAAGAHADAAAILRDQPELESAEPYAYRSVSALWADCTRIATAEGDTAAADAYAAEAVAAIEVLLETGFANVQQIPTVPDLAPLLEREELRELLDSRAN